MALFGLGLLLGGLGFRDAYDQIAHHMDTTGVGNTTGWRSIRSGSVETLVA
jgi:hypothetical protein